MTNVTSNNKAVSIALINNSSILGVKGRHHVFLKMEGERKENREMAVPKKAGLRGY